MKNTLVFLLLIFSLQFLMSSCEKKTEKIPADILSPDSMVAVVADLQLAEATIQLRNLGYTDSTKAQAYGYYKFVLKQHQLDINYFLKSFHYYTNHPALMSKMYTDVLTLLSQKQVKAQEMQRLKHGTVGK